MSDASDLVSTLEAQFRAANEDCQRLVTKIPHGFARLAGAVPDPAPS